VTAAEQAVALGEPGEHRAGAVVQPVGGQLACRDSHGRPGRRRDRGDRRIERLERGARPGVLVAPGLEVAQLAVEPGALGLAAGAAVVELGERRRGGIGGQRRPREQLAGLGEPALELAVAVGAADQLVEPLLEVGEPERRAIVAFAPRRGGAGGLALGGRDRLSGPRGLRQRSSLRARDRARSERATSTAVMIALDGRLRQIGAPLHPPSENALAAQPRDRPRDRAGWRARRRPPTMRRRRSRASVAVSRAAWTPRRTSRHRPRSRRDLTPSWRDSTTSTVRRHASRLARIRDSVSPAVSASRSRALAGQRARDPPVMLVRHLVELAALVVAGEPHRHGTALEQRQ
jgi:hypothetical protein